MPKFQVKNRRFSELKQEFKSRPYELDCQIVRENNSTYVIFVPEWDKQMTVKKEQVII